MGTCYIIGAVKTEYTIVREPEDLVIAADGGYAFLSDYLPGGSADYILGDFDSLGYIPEDDSVPVLRYPAKKDDTDMLLAVKFGLEKGFRNFVLVGGLGGRLDHTVANLQVLAYLSEHGGEGRLIGDNEEVFLITPGSPLRLSERDAGFFSVFSYGEAAEGVTIVGGEYETTEASLSNSFPLGVSNQFIGKPVEISLRKGNLLVVVCR